MKTADIQALNVARSDTLWACRSAFFTILGPGQFLLSLAKKFGNHCCTVCAKVTNRTTLAGLKHILVEDMGCCPTEKCGWVGDQHEQVPSCCGYVALSHGDFPVTEWNESVIDTEKKYRHWTNKLLLSQTGTSVEGHLDNIKESLQPYLLAVGTRRSVIHKFFIVIDKKSHPL